MQSLKSAKFLLYPKTGQNFIRKCLGKKFSIFKETFHKEYSGLKTTFVDNMINARGMSCEMDLY